VFGAGPELDDFPPPTSPGDGSIKGGVARRAVILNQERQAAAAAMNEVLTVSAGDNAMGTLVQVPFQTDAPDFVLLKRLGYDVTTFGNHEFDFGPAALAAAITAAQANGGAVPAVATNIQFSSTDPGDDALAALFEDTGDTTKPVHRQLIIVTPSGHKVGFLGNMGAVAATYAPLKTPVTFSLPTGAMETDIATVKQQDYMDLQAGADTLHAAGAEIVVLLSHAGVNTTDPTLGEDYQIAQNVTGIDVIASAHTHTAFPAQTVMNPTSGKPVVIQQAGSFGQYVGRIVLDINSTTGAVTLDTTDQMRMTGLIAIDSKTVPDATYTQAIDDIVTKLEATKISNGMSFLEQTLSAITGTTVTDNAGMVGDLFFKNMGSTTFAVPGLDLFKETPLEVLVADAELSEAQAWGGADIAVTASGVLRANIDQGKTGVISFADLFRILPLGRSPKDGTVGYPLCRFVIYPAYLKGALELTAGYAYTSEDASTNYLIPAGLRFEFDTSRPMYNASSAPLDPHNGRITKIFKANSPTDPDGPSTQIYECSNLTTSCPGFINGVTAFTPGYVVATSYYIASFAKANGVNLYDPTTLQLVGPDDTIIKRGDGSEVKEWEALGRYIASFPSGALPSKYDGTVNGNFPRRAICSGPLCK
jgi:5'-nucleotidase